MACAKSNFNDTIRFEVEVEFAEKNCTSIMVIVVAITSIEPDI
jgi:hypothetical protein